MCLARECWIPDSQQQQQQQVNAPITRPPVFCGRCSDVRLDVGAGVGEVGAEASMVDHLVLTELHNLQHPLLKHGTSFLSM